MTKRILLTNDDGYRAPGLQELEKSLRRLGKVTVIAPEGEQSASSHSLTLHRPLRVRDRGRDHFTVDGTPTDCIQLGLTRLLEEKPHLVVSGINLGWNLGEDITYSGTVAAALEGVLLGVPSFAISLKSSNDPPDFRHASAFARELARRVLGDGLPPDTLLNVNVPGGEIAGVRWTRQGRRNYGPKPGEQRVPQVAPFLWIARNSGAWENGANSDIRAVRQGFISITPLRLDWTHHAVLKEFSRWEFSFSP